MAATIVGPINVAAGLPGGVSAANNLTGPQVIKAAPGVCVTITSISGTALTLNDCATTGAVAATNEFYSATLTAGQVVVLNWPCAVGIVASAVTGTFSIAFS
jgi:hypothetical protein